MWDGNTEIKSEIVWDGNPETEPEIKSEKDWDENSQIKPEIVWVSSLDESLTDLNAHCDCTICRLYTKPFSTFNFEEKKELISAGRPTPELKNLIQKTKMFTRHFKSDQYAKCEWLTGCPTNSRLFCWSCLLFNDEKNLWNFNGFKDLNNLPKLVKRHSQTEKHLHAMMKWKTFENGQSQASNEDPLSYELRIQYEKCHNKLVRNNRDVLQRFIDAACFLAEHALVSHRLDEPQESASQGIFKHLVQLIAKYDEPLKWHLGNGSVFQFTSNEMLNDLIKSLGKVVLEQIKEEVKETSYVAIILNETSNAKNTSQLSTVLRYFYRGKVKEHFIGFQDVTQDTSFLFQQIKCTIDDFNCADKLIAQSYDGAYVVSDHLHDLQANVRKTYPDATFIHAMAHSLNRVLEQSVSSISECKIFFSTLESLALFVSRSDKWAHALDFNMKNRFMNVAPARWTYGGTFILTVLHYRELLIDLFDNIVKRSDKYWDSDIVIPSQDYLDLLKTDYSFNFLLILFAQIFQLCDRFFDGLHWYKKFNTDYCIKKIDEFRGKIWDARGTFESIWSQANKVDLEPSRKRLRVTIADDDKSSYKYMHSEILDKILSQIKVRFGNFKELKFLELFNFEDNKRIDEKAFESLKKNYGDLFDLPLLRAQLNVIYQTSEGLNKNSVSEMHQSLIDSGLQYAYSEAIKLCELELTIPRYRDAAEGSISSVERIRTFAKSSTGQDRLSHLSILSIEKELTKEMRRKPSFYDAVIDDFAKVERGAPLHFK